MTRIALVTGAARGIGLATTKLFLEEGCHVVMVDNDVEELERAAAPLQNVTPMPYDVSDPEAVATLAAEVEGPISVLVNNAGLADFGPMAETSFERWRAVMATNLDGPFLVTQAFLPQLRATKGAVVNIASISALRASTLRVAYGTSKAGVAHLTEQQAVELGEYGVRVNCVCPGPVRTKLAMAVHTQDIIDAYHDAIPLNRYGQEREIAEAIVWLCSDKASYITGQRLAVDGGFEATGIGLPALRS
ncbi:SDR family NAD(P)-dependent oxidoreductase [Jannaschia seohaensis]|uniref:NAD(P)-dependent dehydrogenase (Short-subunit alcohol dehydrogenase family) n=1 Tax=Jannaschia seohaensis TaxID=475081 RepID=A0A2Y9B3Y5_9RHOB|nr:SDR family oxidoreductase [Jannaschia seohaensis]PWJ12111.1 NAD(P)-dependent dehydrogenase (short-subunit alcohol dehydrogenase family) [Jannaschia seohaensis]SSA51214.1 NAD(P)-dependent dehydrogenase, short-chain alcohol dehydrogenase family [Jannaschia seohaensis]